MKVVSTVTEIRALLEKSGKKPVGFVPTMGALHDGHVSLVKKAVTENPVVVVSIFVNPTQFNDKEDLKNYPRTLDSDISVLQNVMRENDILFTPSEKEIYPEEDKRKFNFGNLDKVMEANHRPGHFNGVAQVVSRLFDIVSPDTAYFGLKDFQQVTIIKELVRQCGYKIKIEGMPIIREPDGLAMSSRNRLLEPQIRKAAPIIYRTIRKASEMISDNEITPVKKFVKETIEKNDRFRVEYFEIADNEKLVPVSSKKEMKPGKRYQGCIAVWAGKIRLIDNIEFPLA